MKRFGLFVGVLLFFLLANAGVGLAAESGFELPAVTGPYGVGTVSLPMVDSKRPGEYADGQHSPGRELMVQIWYPAQPGVDGPRSEYMDELTAAYVLKGMDSSGLDENFRLLIKTHAIVGAKLPVGGKRFPVLLFSQGVGFVYAGYQSMLEDLASHGYIVVGINSPNIAGITVFPDGHAYVVTDLEGDDLIRYLDKHFQEVVDDLKFVAGQLPVLNRDRSLPLSGRIDLSSIGCFGHSYGGAAAVQACIESPMLAAANIDGSLWGEGYKSPILKPMMMMWSEGNMATYGETIWKNLRKPSCQIEIKGYDHSSCSDLYLIQAFLGQLPSDAGSIDPVRAIQITRDCVRTFFDSNLKQIHGNQMEKLSIKYEEVKLETKHGRIGGR